MIGENQFEQIVGLHNRQGRASCIIVCEHASNAIPEEFGDLGLDEAARSSHIAWDPGAMAVAAGLADRIDAPLVHQRVSRLVYDCNRPPHDASAIPARSEVYRIPGNEGLSEAQKADRAERFYEPFRKALSQLIEAGSNAASPAIVTVHTFTPVYFGEARSVEIGILHDEDSRLADAMLDGAKDDRYVVRRNEPYGPRDGVTHTLREHALPRGLLNVMIEIRNDLVATRSTRETMAEWLAAKVSVALESTWSTPCPAS